MSIFNELEIIHRGEYTIGGGITLPFIFHIKDIRDTSVNQTMMSTEYNNILMCKELKNTIDNITDFIDLELFMIDKNEYSMLSELNIEVIQDDLLDKYRIKNKENLIKLIKNLHLTEVELYNLREFIIESQNDLLKEFLDTLHRVMENGVKTEHLSEGFMSIQVCSEFGNGVIFKENVGKCMSEFSFRELETKRAYLSRKYEVEDLHYKRISKGNGGK